MAVDNHYECAKEYKKYKNYEKEYCKTNKKEIAERKKMYRNRNREQEKIYKLKSKYGITFEEYKDLLKKQNNSCAICRKPFDKNISPLLDHNHQTKIVQGLLCRSCNTGLGNFKEDREIMDAAINYLSLTNGNILNS